MRIVAPRHRAIISIVTPLALCSNLISSFLLPPPTPFLVSFKQQPSLSTMSLLSVPNQADATAAAPTTTSTAASMEERSMTTSSDIIPREVLFGNPTYASPKLSPDGKHLSYLAPSPDRGVLNVFVRDTFDPTTSRMVTNDTSRGIRQFFWGQDSESLLYMQDFEGDENFHLWCVNATDITAEARDLTPGEKVKASTVITNKRYPNELLVATNARNSSLFDMYRCQYKTGELVLDTENPGDVVGWGSEDESFEIREALVRNQADSSNTIRVRDSSSSEWRDLYTFPYGEEGGLVEFCNDGGKSCLMTSSIGRETKALVKVDLKSGEVIEEISSNEKCDCQGVILDQDSKEVRAVTYNYARTERVFFDKELENDYTTLEQLGPEGAEVSVSSKSRNEELWVVAYSRSDGPTEYNLYNQTTKEITPLFVSRPDLLNYKFALMEDVVIKTRDGLDMVGYLTRARTTGRSPLILLVHGGPWARDRYGFNPMAQWFANRGYATLQVNFRGSTGYGKSFLHKGDKQWGVGAMQHDLTDAVRWAIDVEKVAHEEKVCIYGGSYGGYACLAGLAFTPELYACGVDIVGPSNVKTLLDSIPPYWGPLRNQMLLKIGDVDSDEEFNKRISPLFHVDNIRAPLLIGQGANDPRVKQAEADQIAFKMKEKGIPVEYVLYPDEGHGFARPQNRIDFNGRVELFLEKHLGGRSEEFVRPEGTTSVFPLEESS